MTTIDIRCAWSSRAHLGAVFTTVKTQLKAVVVKAFMLPPNGIHDITRLLDLIQPLKPRDVMITLCTLPAWERETAEAIGLIKIFTWRRAMIFLLFITYAAFAYSLGRKSAEQLVNNQQNVLPKHEQMLFEWFNDLLLFRIATLIRRKHFSCFKAIIN